MKQAITIEPEPVAYEAAEAHAAVAEEVDPAELERREARAKTKAENDRLLRSAEGRFLLEARDARARLEKQAARAWQALEEAQAEGRHAEGKYMRLIRLLEISTKTVEQLEQCIYGHATTSEASEEEPSRGEPATD